MKIKKFLFSWFFLFLLIFLSACSDSEELSVDAFMVKNNEILSSWKNQISSFFSWNNEKTVKHLNLYFSSPEKNSFFGKWSLKFSYFWSGSEYQASFDFVADYYDRLKRQPLSLTFSCDVLYRNWEDLFLKINHFDLFMGTGNIENEVMHNFISPYVGKWIVFPSWSFSEFSLSSSFLLENFDLFEELFTFHSDDFVLLSGNQFSVPLSSEKIWSLLSPLILPFFNFIEDEKSTYIKVNPYVDPVLSYDQLSSFLVKQIYGLESDFFSFDGEISLSDRQISFVFSDFIHKETYQNLNELLKVLFRKQDDDLFQVSFSKELYGNNVFYGDFILKFKNSEKSFFQGTFFDQAQELVNWTALQIDFEGEMLSSSEKWNPFIVDHVISLSDF